MLGLSGNLVAEQDVECELLNFLSKVKSLRVLTLNYCRLRPQFGKNNDISSEIFLLNMFNMLIVLFQSVSFISNISYLCCFFENLKNLCRKGIFFDVPVLKNINMYSSLILISHLYDMDMW